MRRILFLTLIVLSASCNDKKPKKNITARKTDIAYQKKIISAKHDLKVDSVKKVEIGYYDNFEKLPKLSFETVTESEFLSIEPKKYIETTKPVQNNDFFYIQTALRKHKFKNYRDYGGEESWSGFKYLGYYSNLKLFAIQENSTSDNLGFEQLFLLDSVNDYEYHIISFGDGAVKLQIPSINNRYFVYFYNSVYEHKNCDIGILKINDSSSREKYLSEYASYSSQDFAIDKIAWKTDNIFYVKGYEEVNENGEWLKKYTYYKTEFK
ncbi:hypothetical protein [Flavobacterium algicola]|uniref:hypothetical protein n=1 Tax=Flavobacterium algicola TaxID=556529 RepID=UPI001EFE9ECF|nr:hypothetical protein [Flavobacterium algicola]MCG9792938.1 hypothetical protein [Flavobacterium algicola]